MLSHSMVNVVDACIRWISKIKFENINLAVAHIGQNETDETYGKENEISDETISNHFDFLQRLNSAKWYNGV